MSRSMTHGQFYKELSKRINTTPERAQEVWETTVDFITKELRYYGEIPLPLMANIKLITREGRWTHIPDNHNKGKLLKIYIEPRQELRIKPTENFKESLNNEKITRLDAKRLKEIAKEEELKKQELEKQIESVNRAKEIFEKAVEIKRDNYLKRHNKIKDKPEEVKIEEVKIEPLDY